MEKKLSFDSKSNSCSVLMAAIERRWHRSRRRCQRAGVAPLLQKNILTTPKGYERFREVAAMAMAMLEGSIA
ncbi:hypothetical protein B296_00008064 [Ensete ventricosum]|uniref:Uncharacterized protein n=1 Tax=Ensete ventricosum TaxID=4639 RepID=A0A426YFY4_ENSVE|nr:hypothetical protein B296_00008064 [Ensete ventricosum]